MSSQDHLKTCEYCSAEARKISRQTKAASSVSNTNREKLAGLASYINRTPLPLKAPGIPRTKGASAKPVNVRDIERKVKLEMLEGLGKLVKGL